MRSLAIAPILLALGMLLELAAPAHADTIDERARQLTSERDYKLRLSAALWLAKKPDVRSVAALTRALENDSERTVRRVAAKYLGSLIDGNVPARERARAIEALEHAARRDTDRHVRDAASGSLKKLAALRSSGAKMFVNVGKPSLGKHAMPAGTDDELHRTVRSVLAQQGSDYELQAPSGALPTKAELARRKMRAYRVAATVSDITVRTKGGSAEVRCAVQLQVNPWEGSDGRERWAADRAASATGNGTATASNTRSGIDGAKRDCVLAVAEQVTAKQVVPFLARVASVK